MEEIKKNVHIYIPTSERLERSFWSFIYFSKSTTIFNLTLGYNFKKNDSQFNPSYKHLIAAHLSPRAIKF